VERYGGYVSKYMGDGVLAYFGYPEAHEDDAERAINAGLGIVASVAAGRGNSDKVDRASVRVGIATGFVVVGDMIGREGSQERAVVGQTPNLAARLQGLAEPDTVIIAAATEKLAGGLFELDHRGVHSLKGFGGNSASSKPWPISSPVSPGGSPCCSFWRTRTGWIRRRRSSWTCWSTVCLTSPC